MSQCTAPRRSEGVRFLAIAWPSLMASSALSVFCAKNSRVPSVKTALGATALTRMLSRPSSRARPRVSPITAAFDVHRHRGIPIGFGDRIESPALEAAVKRGVVDEGVDAPECIERGPRHLHCRGGTRDIELGADRGALFGAHELERLRAVVDVRDDDACAEAAEISRVFLPDPARGARNHNDLAFDLHGDIIASA